ncbi:MULTISPECIES: ParB/RepB/Spo0J family partition protein [unclassified Paenibacillus]|uniref:ParB/RepB/Spo0J family partition protein n=1 Tax=unclassified Paenibacillus TaxID=185978 RepID=UPI0010497BDE|nr:MULTISPECIES: ParB/RepB/Spo0J family partition protein [unclassified Paenibacillus]NIK71523.1 ParB family chromosome partitioning protein [Paenibacillus sp. BK720]TCM96171.1 ParB family chromosome partitioning protein [Paenibacillus sp. BK033]
MDIVQLPLTQIDEDTDQPRYQFDEEALVELMRNIEEIGLLSPIKVRTIDGGRYKIIYGNRRYKACKRLGLATIPCIVTNMTDEQEIYLEQIAENLTRQGFSPIEEAEAFNKLMTDPKFSRSVKFLASKFGKPESYIKNKCELLKFGNSVRKLIIGGTEIRKDRLTEDQLLPLKDLPMEHRDPLALIMARDEMPPSDVKKIAKLFKDKDISAATKDKLLYKSGPGLLETWSVQQHNKAEKSKPAEPKAPKAEKPKSTETETATTTAVETIPAPVSPYEAMDKKLNQLLAVLPSFTPLPNEAALSLQELNPEERMELIRRMEALLEQLRSHAEEWDKLKKIAAAN